MRGILSDTDVTIHSGNPPPGIGPTLPAVTFNRSQMIIELE